MRSHSIRSFALCTLALIASAFVFTSPASASSRVDHPDVAYVLHSSQHDISQDLASFSLALNKRAIHREAASFLNSEHNILPAGAAIGRTPFGLKREYAESYATKGLNFIDLSRRC